MNDDAHQKPAANWTIAELGERVSAALSVDYEGQSNGQISDVPSRRTIRYYTTLGLIDRPAMMRGRTALYGPRHLRQLVAIKRLQREGLSLAEVQRRLAGITPATLARIARVPETALGEAPAGGSNAHTSPEAAASAAPPPDPPRRATFWRDPAPEVSAPAEAPVHVAYPSASAQLAGDAAGGAARPLQGLTLAPGLNLLVEGARPLQEADIRAVEEAAQPLLSVLRARGIALPAPWR